MVSQRRHRLNITLEDVARLAGVSMHTIYADVKRGHLNKDDLPSIIEYIKKDRERRESPIREDPPGFLV